MSNLEKSNQGMIEVASSRVAQEVQASMAIAKRFPRDEQASIDKILNACRRPMLAEQAQYEYPKGGTKVTGASIRLAETIAQCWGNIDFGIVELEQRDGESVMMSYAWDLESNTRQTKIFTVPHEMHTKNGVKMLSDPRDIYELTANQGARRLRACILGIIPGDVQDVALEACEKTLKGKSKEPLKDRVEKMLSAFKKYNVTKEQIEKRIGHNLDSITESELVKLVAVFNSIKDEVGKPEQYFDFEVKQEAGFEKKQSADKPEIDISDAEFKLTVKDWIDNGSTLVEMLAEFKKTFSVTPKAQEAISVMWRELSA